MVKKLEKKIPDNSQFFTEYLSKPKHNTLSYQRIPKNHLVLFGAKLDDEYVKHYDDLKSIAKSLDIDIVPLLFKGKVEDSEKLHELLNIDSFLGKHKIEGIFVKNYNTSIEIGGHVYRVMCGKYVSEKFKEKNMKGWKQENTGKGKWEVFCEGFRTEARWLKAIQATRDNGELTESPKDIGGLIRKIHFDICEEEKENIKEFLWEQFKGDILRKSIAGFPEWYKELVLTNLTYKKEE